MMGNRQTPLTTTLKTFAWIVYLFICIIVMILRVEIPSVEYLY